MPRKPDETSGVQEVIPMKKKRIYRATPVKQVRLEALMEAAGEKRVIVGIDIAKEDMFAAFEVEGIVVLTVRWKHPEQTLAFAEMLTVLGARGPVEVAMEPSGTYGDALRTLLEQHKLPVFRVSPKRSHDAAEMFDGVPSYHDAKSAALLCKLHRDGISERWSPRSDHERKLSATVRLLSIYEEEFRRNSNRLESLLARHWPELTQHLKLRLATLTELLATFGGPEGVARHAADAKALMQRVGGAPLGLAKIEAVLTSARQTLGVPQLEAERDLVMYVAREARRAQKLAKEVKHRLEELSQSHGATKYLCPVVGKTTAAVVVASLGDPRNYSSAAAFLKATGLNLKEKSSGKHKGGLHITKRGPGVVRLFLYLAALRLVQRHPVVNAWYQKKVQRQGGLAKPKAVIPIMRKLVLAVWFVARGEAFDVTKLFDVSRLKISPAH
jgi:transposase